MKTLALLTPMLLACLAAPSRVDAHGSPVFVSARDGQLALSGVPDPGEFLDDGFEILTVFPRFDVLAPSIGPPSGTPVGLETAGGLLFWDASRVAPTDALLTIESPQLDSPVDEYPVAAGSAPQGGLLWFEYLGVGLGDLHGVFTLEGNGADPAAGVYGVPIRIVDLSGALAPSDPFVLPFFYGSVSSGQIEQGLDALATAAGDYNRDNAINGADYAKWRADFGKSVAVGSGADGAGDGIINAADYTVWRDTVSAAPPSTAPLAIALPEPTAAALALLACFASQLTLRNHLS